MTAVRSPRAPSLALSKALDKALAAYALVGSQPTPTEDMAQHLGYASLNNGRALATLASLRYFGLLENTGEDHVALSPDLASYLNSAADSPARQTLLRQWLRRPPVFDSLLAQFPQGLPDDSLLHQTLTQRGFLPSSAQSCAAALRQSVAFVEGSPSASPEALAPSALTTSPATPPSEPIPARLPLRAASEPAQAGNRSAEGVSPPPFAMPTPDLSQADCIPVRLSGGRRAWLVIPAVFHEADKLRLKAQIDLLLTTEQDGAPTP